MEAILIVVLVILLLILALIQFASCLTFLLRCGEVVSNVLLTVTSAVLLLMFFLTKLMLEPLLALSRRLRESSAKHPASFAEDYRMNLLELACEIPLAMISFLYNRTVQRGFKKAKSAVSKTSNSSDEGAPWWGKWYSYLLADAEMNGGTLSQAALFTACVVGPRWNTHGGSHMSSFQSPKDTGTLDIEIENLKVPGFWWRATLVDASGKDLGVVVQSNTSDHFVSARMDLPVANHSDKVKVTDEDEEDEETESDTEGSLHRGRVAQGSNLEGQIDELGVTKVTVWVHHYFYGECTIGPLPSVRLRTDEVVGRLDCKKQNLDFLGDLRNRQRNTHLALNWYVFVMLAFKRFLPQDYVEGEMLAGRSAAVAIKYGLVLEGTCLSLAAGQKLLDEHLVFCTVYSRASIPIIRGIELQEVRKVLPPCPEDGFWQIRIVRRDAKDVNQDTKKQVIVCLTSSAEPMNNSVGSSSHED